MQRKRMWFNCILHRHPPRQTNAVIYCSKRSHSLASRYYKLISQNDAVGTRRSWWPNKHGGCRTLRSSIVGGIWRSKIVQKSPTRALGATESSWQNFARWLFWSVCPLVRPIYFNCLFNFSDRLATEAH